MVLEETMQNTAALFGLKGLSMVDNQNDIF